MNILNEKEIEKKGWWRGVIYAVSDIYRRHGDSVAAEVTLRELGQDLHEACRVSCEYDVLPLRVIISDLPFGEDAEYDNLRIIPVDLDDEECTDTDADYYEVRGEYGNVTVTVSRFNERSSAEEFISTNTIYLTENR
ncbi:MULTISPECIES: hypothetical protein [Enterobacteriaceae]|uniref:hypothetical protein n=1 Tax=Enterobacteriaceae TaxID=543 RepID=UPI0019A99E1B|nr:hypothetical protein [Escherichia coli]EGL1882199.1 hypothetical protein [Salmonella enterica]MCL7656547.1 hypothetical protein [Klebsiella pneumoniae]HBB4752953.1 hypothetical protein [Enterobacter cloacae]HCM9607146.1 hypothetical protein [Enterobacter kobei]EGJ2216369.1 hypothetical protein [Escherichia coli]